MQDGEDGAVARGVEEADAFPGTCQRSCFGFAIANDSGYNEIGIVESCAEGVDEDIAKFATFMDGARGGNADMAGDAARSGELAKQAPHPSHILGHLRVNLRIGAFQIDVCHQRGATVSWSGKVDNVCILLLNQPVQVDVDEAEAGRCAPVAEQTRLDMLQAQRLAQQGIVLEIDLSNGQIVGSQPVALHLVKQFWRKRASGGSLRLLRREALSVDDAGDGWVKDVHGWYAPAKVDDRYVWRSSGLRLCA